MSIETYQSLGLTLTQSTPGRVSQIFEPVTLTFLTGYYAGKTLHLGSNAFELSTSQSANWTEDQSQGIRSNATFNNISPRDLSFKVDFFSPTEDISQVSENITHLQEIRPLETDEKRTPPLLRIQVGKSIYNKAFCTNLRINYQLPHEGKDGFKYATAELEFRIVGGKDSEYQNAIPFAPTSLAQQVNSQTVSDRQEESASDVANILLDDCLGEEGSRQLEDLIEQGKLEDVSSLLQLNDELLVQLAIAGLPESVYQDESFDSRLKEAIALELIRKEPGLQNPSTFNHRAISQGIINNNPIGVHPDLLQPLNDGNTLFELLVTDYNEILNAIKGQKLSARDRIFNRQQLPTASDRLLNIGSCGLTLRQVDILPNNDPSVSQSEGLKNINNFLQSNPSDQEVKDYFNLPDNTPETVIRKIKNGRPYSSVVVEAHLKPSKE